MTQLPSPRPRTSWGARAAAAGAVALVWLAASAAHVDAGSDPPVLQQVLSDQGWTPHTTGSEGVKVYKKNMPGQRLLAWKGVKVTRAPADVLFDAILDIPGSTTVDPKRIPVMESVVLKRYPDGVDFFQILNVPGWTLANDRFWFCRTYISRALGGVKGRNTQKWVGLNGKTAYPDKHAEVLRKYSSAVETVQNFGAWETVPLADGQTQVTYRVYTDPGGKIPADLQDIATGKTLPDNINAFDRRARKYAGLP